MPQEDLFNFNACIFTDSPGVIVHVNDEIVTRYMDDKEFQDAVFPILAKEI